MALFNTCIVLISIPPTFCFGLLFAAASSARKSKRAKAASTCYADCTAAAARVRRRWRSSEAGVAAPRTMSLQQERRLWLRALVGFFRGGAELRDVGPIVWRFLNDQPEALRIGTKDGRIQDIPLRCLRAPRVPYIDVAGEVLGFLPGRVGHALGNELCVAAPCQDPDASADPPLRLEGHQGKVTCFAVSGDLVATGSRDMNVCLWNRRDGRCIRVYAAQEWSEWTGTMYLGHVSTVTAVCLVRAPPRSEQWACDDLRLVSGDLYGSVTLWRADGGCLMLHPVYTVPVTCIASEDGAPTFVVGHQDGTMFVASWDDCGVVRSWQGRDEAILAAKLLGHGEEVLAACPRALLRARSDGPRAEDVARFPRPAAAARFEGESLLIYGRAFVALLWLDGCVRVLLDIGGADIWPQHPRGADIWRTREEDISAADICAATLIPQGGYRLDLEESQDALEGASSEGGEGGEGPRAPLPSEQ